MKNLAKFGQIIALCGIFAACGNDSGSNANKSSPEETVLDYLNPNISYGEMTDSRDGRTYKIVTIGAQTWMAENLNYAYNVATTELDSSSFCINNSANYCAKYGRLYLWSAAMDSAAIFSDNGKGCGYGANCSASETVRGTCPEGWHLPNDTEWSTLFTAVGGYEVACTKLKSTRGWSGFMGGSNGEDSYGFSVLPAGYYSAGGFDLMENTANFWSSSENSSLSAYNWGFTDTAGRSVNIKGLGFSVRCIRNSADEGSITF